MEWKISKELVDYAHAVAVMEERIQDIRDGRQDELVWLLEHPPLYTAGTSAKESDLINGNRFPVYKTGRGGQYTYHGPGQRVAYVMLDLKKRTPDVKLFVKNLEQWIIDTLAEFGVKGEVRDGRVGVWVQESGSEKPGIGVGTRRNIKSAAESKIAAVGIRIRRWVTYHGISINISPDLSHYSGIIPCGIRDYGITSLQGIGIETTMDKFDKQLIKSFHKIF